MKKLGIILGIVIISFSCKNADNQGTSESSTTEINVENLVEVTIPVHGMTCEGCENTVKKFVSTLDGIAEVSASHLDSVAVVKYDKTATDVKAIEGKITDAGYVVAKE